MRAPCAAVCLLLFSVGCAPKARISTYNPNFEEVWLGTLDAVSDHLHIEQAQKERGLIVAGTDTRWVRTEAQIEIIERAGQYDVHAKAKDQKLRVLMNPAGLRTGQETDLLRERPDFAEKLLEHIKKRVGASSFAMKKESTKKPSKKTETKAKPKPKTESKPKPKPKPKPKAEAKPKGTKKTEAKTKK